MGRVTARQAGPALPQRLAAEVREARSALIRTLLAERWERRADELFAHFTAAGFSPDEAARLSYSNLLFERHAAKSGAPATTNAPNAASRAVISWPPEMTTFCATSDRMLRQLYPPLARRGGRRVA
jgi:hypothetical protein